MGTWILRQPCPTSLFVHRGCIARCLWLPGVRCEVQYSSKNPKKQLKAKPFPAFVLREHRRLQTYLSSSASPSLSPCSTSLQHVAGEMSPVSCLPGTPASCRAGVGFAWPRSCFAYPPAAIAGS